jgi:hypothetical protein
MISVLVCGGRDYRDFDRVMDTLDLIHCKRRIHRIIHGGASGADKYAEVWASRNDIICSRYPAQWDRYGKEAGPLRNQQMIDQEKIDMVLAFPGGRGTADMIRRATEAGLRIKEIR